MRDSSLTREAARAEEVVQTELTDRHGWSRRSGSGRPRTSPAGRRRGCRPRPTRRGRAEQRERDRPNQRETKTMPRSASRSFVYFVHRRGRRCGRASRRGRARGRRACRAPRGRSRRASADRPPGRRSCGACGCPRPSGSRALHRHRAEHGEPVADAPERLVGAMGEEPVEPDRDPGASPRRVADGEDGQVAPGDVASPEEEDRGEEPAERNRDAEQVRDLLAGWPAAGSAARSLTQRRVAPFPASRGSFATGPPARISSSGRWPCSRCGT